jgi:ketoreductase RED2
MDTAEFAGRVALVTGSSSGIGEAVARRLSALGASVVVNSATSVVAGEAVAASLPGPATYLRGDISVQDEADALVDDTIAEFGRLDVLVNNAGWTTTVPHDQLDDLTDEVFRRTFEVNVFGTWWVTKRAMPHLQAVEDGSIVTVTSVAGLRPVGSSIAYAMTKAALNHMTALLAKSFGPVRVNALAPGLVATPWTADWDQLHAAVEGAAPLARAATPDDCAEAVLALLRNRYVTGEVFVVDGGLRQVM